MENKIGEVSDASIGIRNKKPNGNVTGYSGVCVAFNTDKNLKIGDYVYVGDHDTTGVKPFSIHAVNINSDKQLDVECHEVGYWARKFDRNPDFDLRSLIGCTVSAISDIEAIKNIREQSSWC